MVQVRAGVPVVLVTGAWDMIRCFKAVTTMIAAATEDSYG